MDKRKYARCWPGEPLPPVCFLPTFLPWTSFPESSAGQAALSLKDQDGCSGLHMYDLGSCREMAAAVNCPLGLGFGELP